MTMGMVIISNLLIVVVLEISANNSQIGSDALGDSKKVNNAQLSKKRCQTWSHMNLVALFDNESNFSWFEVWFL